MYVSVSDAKAQLTELVRLAECGDEVILTRHGQPAVRLMPIRRTLTPSDRRKVIEEVLKTIPDREPDGETAARSQDFLYGDDGLPE